MMIAMETILFIAKAQLYYRLDAFWVFYFYSQLILVEEGCSQWKQHSTFINIGSTLFLNWSGLIPPCGMTPGSHIPYFLSSDFELNAPDQVYVWDANAWIRGHFAPPDLGHGDSAFPVCIPEEDLTEGLTEDTQDNIETMLHLCIDSVNNYSQTRETSHRKTTMFQQFHICSVQPTFCKC